MCSMDPNQTPVVLDQCLLLMDWTLHHCWVSHSSHPWDGSRRQTEDSCWSHTRGLPCIQHDRHWHRHLRGHHSHLRLHYKGSLGCNIFFRCSFFQSIFDLQEVQGELLAKVEEQEWWSGEFQEGHSSHPSHGNRDQTSCSCCCHRQGLPDIPDVHH